MKLDKRILMAVCLICVQNFSALSFELASLHKIERRTDSLNYRHSIFIEGLGAGLDGSVGYSYLFAKSNYFNIDLTIGIGAVLEKSNPFTAGLFIAGLNSTFNKMKRLNFSFGIYASNYFNYWGIIRKDKDCSGLFSCPPNYRLILAPKFGVGYSLGRIAIELNTYLLVNWSYFGLWPSLKIKYNLL